MVDVTALLSLLILGVGIALIIYFFNRLNKIICLLEEIKEQNNSRK
ncbi:hypothetical protein SAMN02910293_01048 [Streptococcus henryi]|uniref:CcmD family protein n=1 Tax=Streptococcus henryi TaxID=439219 RepID=A0A1G6BIV6_9STRE|nr:hypothetical protein [Streptococcus henryi]SDB20555.1 hypothetical protein SAMN02910293_01048 [Streptococcus henryi]